MRSANVEAEQSDKIIAYLIIGIIIESQFIVQKFLYPSRCKSILIPYFRHSFRDSELQEIHRPVAEVICPRH